MPKPSPKTEARREKFRKLGRAISLLKQGDPNAPDYHTGKPSSFELKRGDQGNRENGRVEIPGGPKFKTPQWERTLR